MTGKKELRNNLHDNINSSEDVIRYSRELKKRAVNLILQLTDDEVNVLMAEFKKYREKRTEETNEDDEH